MVIALNPEQEQVVQQAIESGHIEKPEDVIGPGLGATRRRLETERDPVYRLSLNPAEHDQRIPGLYGASSAGNAAACGGSYQPRIDLWRLRTLAAFPR